MTTPGGVPNLPQGALTIDTLESKTQDMSTPAMRARAAERFPNIFNSSTGGNPLNDLTPMGIITAIFSGFNSVVANADPADVQGPEDLPGLLLDFIESLPVVGELIGLLEAITGTYTGDDPVLLQVQEIFEPIRAIVDAILGLSGGLAGIGGFFNDIPLIGDLVSAITGSSGDLTDLASFFNDIPIIGDLVEAITGTSGGLGNLTDFFSGLVPLDELVAALTGSPGDLADLVSWVGNIPFLSDIVAALTGGGGGLGSLTAWADQLINNDIFQELIESLSGVVGGGFDDIIERLEDFLTGSSPLPAGNIIGEIVDDLVPGIGELLGNIFGGITGLNPANVTHAQTANAVAAQSATVTGAAAAVARLETAFTSGISTGDDFERTTSGGLGTNWALTYSSGPGQIKIDGHNAVWDDATLTTTARTVVCRWTGTNAASLTDYQRVTIVLGSVPQDPLIGTAACNDILLRMDSGSTNFIRVRFKGDDTVSIRRIVGGVETVMNSGSLTNSLSSGASLTGEAGKFGAARYYRALVNGFPVLEWTEAGTDAMLGASYRGWGFGMRADADSSFFLVPAQSTPGAVKQWTASDQ